MLKSLPMYTVSINVPPVLNGEITQLFFSCGAISVSEKKQKRTITLTALAPSPKPFLKQFSADLLKIKKRPAPKIKTTAKKIQLSEQKTLTLLCHDAFGDGEHPTTKVCMSFLQMLLSKDNSIHSLCDIGCGSGILALSAYHYGLKDILAIDNDKLAVLRAKQNMRQNHTKLRIETRDIIRQPLTRKYDLVIANMNSAILEAAWKNITTLVPAHGFLILSGIGTQWSTDIRKRLLDSSFKIIKTKELSGWWSAVCIRTAKRVK